MFTLYRTVVYRADTKIYPVLYEHLSVTEIAPKSLFLCVNRSPLQYGFCAGVKALRYNVKIVLNWPQKQSAKRYLLDSFIQPRDRISRPAFTKGLPSSPRNSTDSGRAITEIGVRAMITRLLVYGHYFKVDNYERRIIHVRQTWARILGGNVLGEFVYAMGKSCGVFGPFNVSPIDHSAGKNIANVSLPRVVI